MAGCATIGERYPVPAELAGKADIPGIGAQTQPIRYWDAGSGGRAEDVPVGQLVQANLVSAARKSELNFLSLSGGGYNGTFGTGFLVGWTERGDRPQFDFVSGISVGALIAPFAFLGPDHDADLLAAFERISTSRSRGPGVLGVFFGAGGIQSNAAIADAVESIITEETLSIIGDAHRKGRRLLIGTTNLDAERPVVWDIGAIAISGIPHRVELVRKILLASAAVPGIYPPVLINVEVNGETFDELHVDGSVTQQLVVIPSDVRVAGDPAKVNRNLYVIYNGNIDPTFEPVTPDAFNVVRHSIPTFLKTLGRSDLEKLRAAAQRNHAAFKLAAIPETFRTRDEFPPDPDYLDSLLRLGHEMGRAGRWSD